MGLLGMSGASGKAAPASILPLRHAWSMLRLRHSCVCMELIGGHHVFNKHWMTCYDYNLLRQPHLFEEKLGGAVGNLGTVRALTPANGDASFLSPCHRDFPGAC
eukprot:scaffold1289_cov274-Pinguiococcus_pyrenoidosus.AAC.21